MTDMDRFDISRVRDDFDAYRDRRPGFAYLDTGASSLTPRPVLEAVDAYYRECRANVHRGMYAESMEATERYEAARAKVAASIGAAPEEVIFTSGATAALNVAAYALSRDLGPGDEAVVSVMEHHANLVPWQQLAKQRGFVLKFIPITKDNELDLEAANGLIGGRTKVVAVTGASNVLGTMPPVRALADMAHAVGATFVLDAAQLAGHAEMDVKRSDCDLMAFSGHKMYAPTGIGVLYGKRALLERMPPVTFGGDMIIEVTKDGSIWNDLPYKFEAGTPNIAGAIGLGAAVDWAAAVGEKVLRTHESALVASCIERVSAIDGVTVHGPPKGGMRGAVVSMTMTGVHPHDLTDILGREGVCVRGGHHCAMPLMAELGLMGGTTRASFGAYNGEDDIDLLVAALGKAATIFNRH